MSKFERNFELAFVKVTFCARKHLSPKHNFPKLFQRKNTLVSTQYIRQFIKVSLNESTLWYFISQNLGCQFVLWLEKKRFLRLSTFTTGFSSLWMIMIYPKAIKLPLAMKKKNQIWFYNKMTNRINMNHLISVKMPNHFMLEKKHTYTRLSAINNKWLFNNRLGKEKKMNEIDPFTLFTSWDVNHECTGDSPNYFGRFLFIGKTFDQIFSAPRFKQFSQIYSNSSKMSRSFASSLRSSPVALQMFLVMSDMI